MNEKQINLLKDEIKFLEKKIEEQDELIRFLYRNGYEDIQGVFQPTYKIRQTKRELESKLELYQMLTEKGIDTEKNYYLFDDVYLSISELRPFFYIEYGNWIYDNYINSWSGTNEWITDLIDSEYSLFSGNSPYCHAFNTMTMKELFRVIENKEVDNSRKVSLIENLVEFTKENGKFKDIHNQVVKSVKFKINTMKEILKND